MPKTKKRKISRFHRFHLGWRALLLILFLAAAIVLLVLVVKQKTSPVTKPTTQSDRLADTYNPPGAATPSATPQVKAKLPEATQSVRVPILLYHYVEYNRDPKDTIRTKLSVTPFWFEKQLQYLQANGYKTITFNDLYSAIRKRGQLPPRPVILTFDDGYRDFYTDAWPILKKYNAKATVFVIPGFLDQPNYLFSWQLSQMATDSSHLVTIGAHTMHHPSLPTLKPDKAFAEIFDSKKILERMFDQPVTVFNYPYGQFDDSVRGLVKQAGFQMAVSTLFGETESWENAFILPRIRVGNYAGTLFASRLNVRP